MASSCATSSCLLVLAPSACPSSKKTTAARFRRRRTMSCRATGGAGRGDNDGFLWLPRRDVMLNGLSGVAAGLAWYPGLASGADSPCTTADKVNEDMLLCTDDCPMPWETALKDFKKEDFKPWATRVREPVHRLSRENQAKYKDAVRKMKELPESNPLSFKAQAAIHQAYCDSYYKYHRSTSAAKDDVDPTFDVHFSWIFAPWHRMYIYFYERALGQLIGDNTFALPYWNWDSPDGMVVPALFKDDSFANPLYNPNRNRPAYLDALVDLDYQHKSYNCSDAGYKPIPFEGPKDAQEYTNLVNKNLCTVHAQQVGKGPESFLGEKYCTKIKGGLDAPGMGTLERMAHTAMHVWVGKAGATPCDAASGGVPNHGGPPGSYNCNNDMGFLGSASKDPLFYSHHSNVDRMWHIWSLRGGKDFTDPDWLDTSFVFYDNVERPRKVRISVRDVLNTRDLGYEYAAVSDEDLPWLKPKFTSLVSHGEKSSTRSTAEQPTFPLALTKCQVVEVSKVQVPPRNDAGKEQLLVIDGIQFESNKSVKFDVAINVPAEKALLVGPQYNEYAGSFAVVPGSSADTTRRCRVCLCITSVLSNIEFKPGSDDSTVDVVIVPRTDNVTLNERPTIKNRE